MVNGKQYIGVHSTDVLDDGYLGSSKLVDKDIRLFGKENFIREILLLHESRDAALQHERELVDKDWVLRPDTYNLHVGGAAYPRGFRVFSTEHRQKIKDARQHQIMSPMSAETKRLIGTANRCSRRPDLSKWNATHLRNKKRGPQSEEHKRKRLEAFRATIAARS